MNKQQEIASSNSSLPQGTLPQNPSVGKVPAPQENDQKKKFRKRPWDQRFFEPNPKLIDSAPMKAREISHLSNLIRKDAYEEPPKKTWPWIKYQFRKLGQAHTWLYFIASHLTVGNSLGAAAAIFFTLMAIFMSIPGINVGIVVGVTFLVSSLAVVMFLNNYHIYHAQTVAFVEEKATEIKEFFKHKKWTKWPWFRQRRQERPKKPLPDADQTLSPSQAQLNDTQKKSPETPLALTELANAIPNDHDAETKVLNGFANIAIFAGSFVKSLIGSVGITQVLASFATFVAFVTGLSIVFPPAFLIAAGAFVFVCTMTSTLAQSGSEIQKLMKKDGKFRIIAQQLTRRGTFYENAVLIAEHRLDQFIKKDRRRQKNSEPYTIDEQNQNYLMLVRLYDCYANEINRLTELEEKFNRIKQIIDNDSERPEERGLLQKLTDKPRKRHGAFLDREYIIATEIYPTLKKEESAPRKLTVPDRKAPEKAKKSFWKICYLRTKAFFNRLIFKPFEENVTKKLKVKVSHNIERVTTWIAVGNALGAGLDAMFGFAATLLILASVFGFSMGPAAIVLGIIGGFCFMGLQNYCTYRQKSLDLLKSWTATGEDHLLANKLLEQQAPGQRASNAFYRLQIKVATLTKSIKSASGSFGAFKDLLVLFTIASLIPIAITLSITQPAGIALLVVGLVAIGLSFAIRYRKKIFRIKETKVKEQTQTTADLKSTPQANKTNGEKLSLAKRMKAFLGRNHFVILITAIAFAAMLPLLVTQPYVIGIGFVLLLFVCSFVTTSAMSKSRVIAATQDKGKFYVTSKEMEERGHSLKKTLQEGVDYLERMRQSDANLENTENNRKFLRRVLEWGTRMKEQFSYDRQILEKMQDKICALRPRMLSQDTIGPKPLTDGLSGAHLRRAQEAQKRYEAYIENCKRLQQLDDELQNAHKMRGVTPEAEAPTEPQIKMYDFWLKVFQKDKERQKSPRRNGRGSSRSSTILEPASHDLSTPKTLDQKKRTPSEDFDPDEYFRKYPEQVFYYNVAKAVYQQVYDILKPESEPVSASVISSGYDMGASAFGM